jgi:hypothetical protein
VMAVEAQLRAVGEIAGERLHEERAELDVQPG